MPTPAYNNYISQITLTNGTTYHIKDAEAREWIAGGLSFKVAWNGQDTPVVANIPYGVVVVYEGEPYTGALAATAQTRGFYLVYEGAKEETGAPIYGEYVTVNWGTESDPVWGWEKLGDTDGPSGGGGKEYALQKGSGDNVLGEGTTFTNSSSAVSFSGGTSDTFVKSYAGAKNKLETTTIKGVGTDVTFNAVASATPTTATNTVFGTDTTASKIETETKTASSVTLGNATTVATYSSSTNVDVPVAAGTATPISRIQKNSDTFSILETATVTGETLTFGSVQVGQSEVKGVTDTTVPVANYTLGSATITGVADVEEINIASVKTNTDVTVPVVSSNTTVNSTLVTTEAKTAATAAASATTVATGSLNASDTVGAEVMTGLGTVTTASAVTNVGTGTAAAQTITVGTDDVVKVAKYDDLELVEVG